MLRFRSISHATAALAVATLTGCAGLPSDRGVPDVQKLVAERSGQQLDAVDAATQPLVDKLLKAPLTVDGAVRVALLNNPRVRHEYARLGIAGAEVYDAGRLSNPRFSVSSLESNVTGEVSQLGFGLVQSFTDLLLLPARSRLAAGEFARAKEQAGQALLSLAADVEIAYCNLVGLQQTAALQRSVATAAQAAADLGQRFFDAGNLSARELAQQRAATATARTRALQAETEVLGARSALNELLGLAPDTADWHTLAELPAPPDHDDDAAGLIPLALQRRLDLAAQRREVALLNDALGTARHFRYLGSVEIGAETERETDRSRITGPTLSLELPVFNQGVGNVARAQALVEQAQSALETLQLAIANNVRLQSQRAAAARGRAEQLRTQLIPAREEVVKRTQQEVSYMLEGQFRLLEVKQQEYEAYQAYIEAVRDYWVARAELGREVGTRLPEAASPPETHARLVQAPMTATTPASQTPTATEMPDMDMHDAPSAHASLPTARPDTEPAKAGEQSHPGGAQ